MGWFCGLERRCGEKKWARWSIEVWDTASGMGSGEYMRVTTRFFFTYLWQIRVRTVC